MIMRISCWLCDSRSPAVMESGDSRPDELAETDEDPVTDLCMGAKN